MKLKYAITIVLFLSVFTLGFAQCLSDNFDTSYGNWVGSDTYRLPLAGYEAAGIGFNSEYDNITTALALTHPKSIQFLLAQSPSSSNRSLSVEYSASALANSWTNIATITAAETTETHQLFSIDLNLTGQYFIRIIMTDRDAGSFYLDNVTVFCDGSNAPELQLLDDSGNFQNCGFNLDFGETGLNESSQKIITIKNTGDTSLSISNFTTTSNFSIQNATLPISIPPDSDQQVTLIFSPSESGALTGELHIINSDNNEGDCSIILNGFSYTPAPEIDLERNTRASIPSGSEANNGYNTIFAATNAGETAASKTFYIHNEGEEDLELSAITSSNPIEFQIISNPTNTTLSSHTEVAFQIQFTPSDAGIRTSIISIVNNDPNEGTYTFEVQGTGTCSSTPLTAQPNTGPPGTRVRISGSHFGSETTANLNGISADVFLISDTNLEVRIPNDATSGSLIIVNDLGCSYSTNFNLNASTAINCDGESNNLPTNLIISEVTDHPTGSHSYIEIFNGTGNAISLADYSIEIHYNGSTVNTIQFDNTILNHLDTFVIAFGGGDATETFANYESDHLSSKSGINNNDNIQLLYQGSAIDLWGNTTGEIFTISNKGYTYRRKNNLNNLPSTIWNPLDWEAFKTVDYTDIGIYYLPSGEPPIIVTQPTINGTSCSLTAQFTTVAEEGLTGGKELQYQWFYNPPDSDSWTEVTNDAYHDNAQSASLNILNTTQRNGYQYYCRVLEDDDLCFTASNTVTISINDRVWTPTGWLNNLIPDANSFITLNTDYNTLTHGNLTGCGLYIPIDNTLIIESESFVKVTGETRIDGELNIKNQGSFVQVDNIENTNTGTITVEKETAILNNWDEYTYWSTPVKSVTFDAVFYNSKKIIWFKASNFVDVWKETNNNNIFVEGQDDVDDDGNAWQLVGNGESITRADYLQIGVGYPATHSNINFTAGDTYTYTFSGDLNNGTIYTPVERNDVSRADENWNLIGNPYPSAIDITAFFEANVTELNSEGTLEGVIHLWSHDTPASEIYNGNFSKNFNPSDYVIINGSGAIAAQEGPENIPDNYIGSCQGFFVKFSDTYPSANGQVVFNNDMRVTDNNTQFYKQSGFNKIWLNLTSDNGVFSQTLVSYMPGAKNGFDSSYFDVEIYRSIGTPAKLYSRIKDYEKKLTIQGRAVNSLTETEIINLGFYTNIQIPTIFKLSVANLEGRFLNSNVIFLYDAFKNIYHDLKDSDYTFTSEPGDFNNRFHIQFRAPTLAIETLDLSKTLQIVQIDEQQWLFKSTLETFQIEKLAIFDMLGQIIYQFNAPTNNHIYNLPNLNSGSYILLVTDTNNQSFRKKFIKK